MAKTMNCLALVLLSFVLAAQRQDVAGDADACNRRYMRRLNGKCYYFSVKKLNWFGALNNCLRKGLVLADVKRPRDFTAVVTFLASKGNSDDFWFSGNDLQHEGRYQYISNGRLVKYFSNNSMLSPSQSSDCDDCLEIRIREDKTLVTYDSCREPQYFICSERYCDEDQIKKKKPRHHSHEHLHHFHHDIGPDEDDEGDEDGDFGNNGSAAQGSNEGVTESEGGVGGGEYGNSDEHTTPEYTDEKANATEGASTTPTAGAEQESSTAAPSDGNEAETTAASDGAGTTTAASPSEGDAAASPTPAAAGEGDAATTAAPAEGEAAATPAVTEEGEAAATPAATEGDAATTAAPAEGEAATTPAATGEGDAATTAAPAEGDAAATPAATGEGDAATTEAPAK